MTFCRLSGAKMNEINSTILLSLLPFYYNCFRLCADTTKYEQWPVHKVDCKLHPNDNYWHISTGATDLSINVG